MASQLHEAIAQLESEVTEARASGDAKRIKEAEEALSARQAWLRAVEG
jgi:DNA-binding protein H-NS